MDLTSQSATRGESANGEIRKMEDMETEILETTDATTEIAPEVEMDSTAEKMFSQNEVNAFLAKETSKIKRRLRKQTNKTIEADQPAPDEGSATVQALEKILSRLESLESASATAKKDGSFESMIAGREIDSDVRDLLYQTYDPANPDATAVMISKLAPAQEAPAQGYSSPGAPSQSAETMRGLDPMQWSKDDIEVLKREGRFLESLEQWRASLPGGGNGLMATKLRKKKRG